ncbi:MAG: hypothetical protein ACRCUT_07820, partial [Spirochaetota bacterium]
DLQGGSQMFPYDSEVSSIKSDISGTFREYSPETMAMFMGGIKTIRESEAAGAVDELANVKGTSMVNATTGIASIGVIPTTGAANLKTGRYVIRAIDTDTIRVFACQDIDSSRGTEVILQDNLAISSTDIDVSGITIDIAAIGVRLTLGSGTIAFTADDTCEFWVRKPNTGSYDVKFGQSGAEFPEFGLMAFGQKSSDGSINMIEFYRVKSGGMPINFKEKGWSEWSGTFKALYDESKNSVGRFRRVSLAA